MISGDYSSNISNNREINLTNPWEGIKEEVKQEASSYAERARKVVEDRNLTVDEKIKQLQEIKAEFEDWIQKEEEDMKADPASSAADLKALEDLRNSIGFFIDSDIASVKNSGKISPFDLPKQPPIER
jgi:DNA repair exonuclease SbcCD ATPase subunit